MERDLHQSLKSEVIATKISGSGKFVVAKLQWGKIDVGYSLHVDPNGYSISGGYQTTDFLSHIGFQSSTCPFTGGGKCFCKWVDADFDLEKFVPLFDSGFNKMCEAQKDLERCGFLFDNPEGLSYFGMGSGRQHRSSDYYDGDGHTAAESKFFKTVEDSVFYFKFTWLKNDDRDKGWVIHYRPKNGHMTAELSSVFNYLKINNALECPQYDFESCRWRYIAYESYGDSDSFDNGNTNAAHAWFNAHEEFFSKGIEKLLSSNTDIEKAGLHFLPLIPPQQRNEEDIRQRTFVPELKSPKSVTKDFDFDVAISFAGTDRENAEKLAVSVRNAGFSVFYDNFYPEDLWGKDLTIYFDEIFRKRSRYCVIFASKEYNAREWTIHERRSAYARSLAEKGNEYILPIKIDETELDGLPPTICYLPISLGIEKVSEILVKKLNSTSLK